MRHTSRNRRGGSGVTAYRGAPVALISRPPREVDDAHPACPICGGGVARNVSGTMRSHAPGGWTAPAGGVKCLGTGQ